MLNLDEAEVQMKKCHAMRHLAEPHTFAHEVSIYIYISISKCPYLQSFMPNCKLNIIH